MPILKNAKKALRASKRKTIYNRRVKSQLKTAQDALKKEPTAANLRKAQSAIDKAVKKNIINQNKAARLKAGLYKLCKEAGIKLEAKSSTKKTTKKKTSSKKAATKKTKKKATKSSKTTTKKTSKKKSNKKSSKSKK